MSLWKLTAIYTHIHVHLSIPEWIAQTTWSLCFMPVDVRCSQNNFTWVIEVHLASAVVYLWRIQFAHSKIISSFILATNYKFEYKIFANSSPSLHSQTFALTSSKLFDRCPHKGKFFLGITQSAATSFRVGQKSFMPSPMYINLLLPVSDWIRSITRPYIQKKLRRLQSECWHRRTRSSSTLS